jgi:hypothetical protein
MSDSPFLILQLLGPMRLPMRVDAARGELVQAEPKSAFDSFPSMAAALEVVQRARDPEDLVAYPVELWLEERSAAEKRAEEQARRATDREARRKKREDAEELADG